MSVAVTAAVLVVAWALVGGLTVLALRFPSATPLAWDMNIT